MPTGSSRKSEEARLYGHYGLDYDEERVRLQRWVEAERTQAVPMANDGAWDAGDPLGDDNGHRSTMGGHRMEPERHAGTGLPAEGRSNPDENAGFGEQRADGQAFGPQVDVGREAPRH